MPTSKRINPKVFKIGDEEYTISTHLKSGHRASMADELASVKIPNAPRKLTENIPLRRLIAIDGVTPRDSSLAPYDLATFASAVTKNGLVQSANIPEALLRVNNRLHNFDWKTFSPQSMLVIGDIYVDPNCDQFELVGEFYASGDSEIYVLKPNGWEMLHGKQMLSIEAQKEFNILLEEVRVFWDGADEAFKNDSLDEFVNDLVRNNVNEFLILNGLYDILAGKNNYTKLGLIKKRITEAMLIPREEQITANRDSYVSPPLGRYTNEELSSDGFKLVSLTNTEQTGPHVSGFEAVVLCTDGVKVDTDILNDQTTRNIAANRPRGIVPIELFEQAHSGADLAVVTLY